MISYTNTTLKHAILRTGHVCVLCARAVERADEPATKESTRCVVNPTLNSLETGLLTVDSKLPFSSTFQLPQNPLTGITFHLESSSIFQNQHFPCHD
jgi:hypothetical protein